MAGDHVKGPSLGPRSNELQSFHIQHLPHPHSVTRSDNGQNRSVQP